MTTTLNRLRGYLETLQAIEMLQYHDKNHLYWGTEPAKLSREVQDLLRSALGCIADLEKAESK